MNIRRHVLRLCFAISVMATSVAPSFASAPVKWSDALHQPREWYSTEDALRIADNVVLYQRTSGGWPKNIDMAAVIDTSSRAEILKQKSTNDSTIDNGATYSQMMFLARVYTAKPMPQHKASFLSGLDYFLKAQYANGGWPQYFPLKKGYYEHITFNDGAMVGVLRVLRDVSERRPDYLFVDEPRRELAAAAVAKGIECILKTQVVVKGRRTVWCAQHDEITLAPAAARAYEHISLSGQESVGIVQFLMGIEHPDSRVVEAVESAIAWFKSAQLNDVRSIPAKGETGAAASAAATPTAQWARFYEIETNRPIFSGRDGVIKYNLSEIERERREGYHWYTDAPAKLLSKDYPKWLKKVSLMKARMN